MLTACVLFDFHVVTARSSMDAERTQQVDDSSLRNNDDRVFQASMYQVQAGLVCVEDSLLNTVHLRVFIIA
jgi:hypothetical protein